ncbi:MAG: cupin domain-containing protein [Chlorobiaceae bacterium]|nr:cupin domain-containing protein [Chlorobiaceae bacterium]
MQKAEFWIRHLQLEPHPEGGYYRETYRSKETYAFGSGTTFGSPRNHATAIYYLLRTGERSRLHSILSDELWFYHAGLPLTVHIFPLSGNPSAFTLGADPEQGHLQQGCVPAGCRFGASQTHNIPEKDGYSLVSCVVAPGFDFRDFTFAEKGPLLARWPAYAELIDYLA